MRFKLYLLTPALFVFKVSFAQNYFDFFYTNISKARYDNFSTANSNGLGWIQTGNYTFPPECGNCADYQRDSKLKKERLDSLVAAYKASGISKIYAGKYVTYHHFFATNENTKTPFIIKTLYRIDDGKPIPILQIKMTFYNRPNKNPGILNIEIADAKSMSPMDTKIVISSYKKAVKNDSEETPPPVEKFRK